MSRPQPDYDRSRQRLVGAASLWLLLGCALLGSRLLPLYSPQLGWSAAFWLLGAPLVMLLTLAPGLPLRLLALGRTRRRAPRAAVWN